MRTIEIDFVSDIACPWCVIGLLGLEQALQRLAAEGISAQIPLSALRAEPADAA